jgi:hypothetical protein
MEKILEGALLFTWLITHCDGQGRIPGKAKVIKQQVVPFIDEITEEDISQALELMREALLVILYNDSNGRQLIQVSDWWEWQTGFRFKAASHYEPPKEWIDQITPRDDNGRFTRDGSISYP